MKTKSCDWVGGGGGVWTTQKRHATEEQTNCRLHRMLPNAPDSLFPCMGVVVYQVQIYEDEWDVDWFGSLFEKMDHGPHNLLTDWNLVKYLVGEGGECKVDSIVGSVVVRR